MSPFIQKSNQWIQQSILKNIFFSKVETNQFELDGFNLYLSNLAWMFSKNFETIQLSMQCASYGQLHELAHFYKEKQTEEQGHDVWALNDLRARGIEDPETFVAQNIKPQSRRLIEDIQEQVRKHPIAMLSYMFFLEYFTIQVGRELFAKLQRNLGIRSDQYTSILNHVELDQAHTQEDLEMIERFCKTPEDEQVLLHVLDQTAHNVNEFLNAFA